MVKRNSSLGAVPISSDYGKNENAEMGTTFSAPDHDQSSDRDRFGEPEYSAGTHDADQHDQEWADGDDDTEKDKDVMILTDLPEVLPLLETNLVRWREDRQQKQSRASVSNGNDNMSLHAGKNSTENDLDLRVRSLPWGDRAAADSILSEVGEITHILCSDLVSLPRLHNVVFLFFPSGSKGHTMSLRVHLNP